MSCLHPIDATRLPSGEVKLYVHPGGDPLSLPCGQCIECRLSRARMWSVRCMHEAQMHSENSFVTLTYDDDHLPADGQLDYPQVQKFLKRLRKGYKPFRFFLSGEYGDENDRPHYHICFFGLDFDDKRYWSRPRNHNLYRSPTLERLWPYGSCLIGSLTYESAGYTARYCVKKITGKAAFAHYLRTRPDGTQFQLVPPFMRCSLKPGIGEHWFRKFCHQVHDRDYIIQDGVKVNVPAYYDKLLKRKDPDVLDNLKAERVLKALPHAHDNTRARLAVKEQVALARTSSLKRSL